MANTYTQLYVQFVFSVKSREKCVPPAHQEEVQRYITTIVSNENQKLMAIYCMPDHIHILVGYNPEIRLSELIRKIKTESNKFINRKNWMPAKFEWQVGFGAFTYSKSQVNKVIQYILNQEEHHRNKTFKEEYRELLDEYDVDYNEDYLFDLD